MMPLNPTILIKFQRFCKIVRTKLFKKNKQNETKVTNVNWILQILTTIIFNSDTISNLLTSSKF